MTNIPFMKLSGAGNDFVIIDNLESIVPYESTDFVAKVCERRMSVGADGVLLVEKSDGADFKMRYFNADGGEADTCGNGARCISKFAYINRIASERMRFETKAGIYESEILESGVKVRMSNPTDVRLNFLLRLEDACTPFVSLIAACPTWCFLLKISKQQTLLISEGKHAITMIFSRQGRTQILYESKANEKSTFALTSGALKMKPSLAVPARLRLLSCLHCSGKQSHRLLCGQLVVLR